MTTSKEEAKQAFDGIMLSDGSLPRRDKDAYFSMSLSDTKKLKSRPNIPTELLLDYLEQVKLILNTLDVDCQMGYPKVYHSETRGKKYEGVCLYSLDSPLLTFERDRWYTGGRYTRDSLHGDRWTNAKKVVPEDLVLTPILLSYWFMGDGSSSFDLRRNGSTVYAGFSTCDFSEEDNTKLAAMLNAFGIRSTVIRTGSRRYPYISVSQWGINRLMDCIELYMHPAYAYKIKKRKEEPWQEPQH